MSLVSVRTIAPIAAMGATWAARRGMTAVYTARTGHQPPQAEDREVSITRVIVWAVTTAIVSATIQVVITRMAADYGSDDESSAGDAHQLEAATA